MQELVEKAKARVSEGLEAAKGGIKAQLNQFSNLSTMAKEKVAESIEELIELAPQLEAIGYKVVGMGISMGLPPAADFRFDKISETSSDKVEALLERYKENTMLTMVIKALISADDFQDKIKLGRFTMEGIEIQLGLCPAVKLLLVPRE